MSPCLFSATGIGVPRSISTKRGYGSFGTSMFRTYASGNLNNVQYKPDGTNPADIDLNLALGIFSSTYFVLPLVRTTGSGVRRKAPLDLDLESEHISVKMKINYKASIPTIY